MLKFPKWNDSQFIAGLINILARMLLMLIPTMLLVGASLRTPGPHHWILWMGTFFQTAVCCLSFFSRRSWHQSISPAVITLYLIALCWVWLGSPVNDWYISMAKAILILVPLVAFAHQTLSDSGAPAIRRARLLAQRLAQRHEWPNDLPAIRALPEVKALRAALHRDAAPALALLFNTRLEVRVAALAALEFRKEWKPGQADLVLQTAQRAEQPIMRAVAVSALANVDDRELIERVAGFLHDPSLEVRQAAAEALLWDTEKRWHWIRFAVRRALADPLFQHDGPIWHDGQQLTIEATNDLTAWSAEKGVLAVRAAATLGVHFNRVLTERGDAAIRLQLRDLLASRSTPSVLRIELGRCLQYHQELEPKVLERILDPSNPTPLRLIAIETVISETNDGLLYDAAVASLRDLARLPNREIALTAAALIQRKLGVDLGLGIGETMPPLHSRQAAEITRRVMLWATQEDEEELEDSRPFAVQPG